MPRNSLQATVPLDTLLSKRLQTHARLTPEHEVVFWEMAYREQQFQPNTELIAMGETHRAVYVVLYGWAARYRFLRDGRRQILGFALPGDFVCLDACAFERAGYTVSTLTAAGLATLEISQLLDLAHSHPELTAMVLWSTAREESLLMEGMVSLGRRTAYERVAHILLELHRRLEVVGLAEGGSFSYPLSQSTVADLLGLSPVHVSRTFKRLQADGLVTVHHGRNGRVDIHDYERLCDLAEFEQDYLAPRGR